MPKKSNLDLPVLDLLTSEEITNALVRAVLAKHLDADVCLAENDVTAKVYRRSVPMPDGSKAVMASVAILSVTPKPPPTAKDE